MDYVQIPRSILEQGDTIFVTWKDDASSVNLRGAMGKLFSYVRHYGDFIELIDLAEDSSTEAYKYISTVARISDINCFEKLVKETTPEQ